MPIFISAPFLLTNNLRCQLRNVTKLPNDFNAKNENFNILFGHKIMIKITMNLTFFLISTRFEQFLAVLSDVINCFLHYLTITCFNLL